MTSAINKQKDNRSGETRQRFQEDFVDRDDGANSGAGMMPTLDMSLLDLALHVGCLSATPALPGVGVCPMRRFVWD